MSIPEDANELSKTVGAISTIRLSNPRLRNMLSLQMTIIPSNVRSTNFRRKKLVRISKLTVPRAETAVELDVYGVFGILRGNSVADQDDFIRETDFCGH